MDTQRYTQKDLCDLPTGGHKRFSRCTNCKRNGQFHDTASGTVICRVCGTTSDLISDLAEDSQEFHQYIDVRNDNPFLGCYMSSEDMAKVLGVSKTATHRYRAAIQAPREKRYWKVRPIIEQIVDTLELPHAIFDRACALLLRVLTRIEKSVSASTLALASVLVAARRHGVHVDAPDAIASAQLDCRHKAVIELLEEIGKHVRVPHVSREMYLDYYGKHFDMTRNEKNIALTVIHDFVYKCCEMVSPKTMVCIALCIALFPRDRAQYSLVKLSQKMGVIMSTVYPRLIKFCKTTNQKQYLDVLHDYRPLLARKRARDTHECAHSPHERPKTEKRPKTGQS